MSMQRTEPFRIRGALGGGPIRGNWLEPIVERISGLDHLSRLYQLLPPAASADEFLEQVVRLFGFQCVIAPEQLVHVPPTGAAVLVANHPFGGLEGVLLARALRQIRPDVKVMANQFLRRIPELAELFIGVDPFDTADARRQNSRPLREALRFLKNGGLLVIFPAGEVSHFRPGRGISDPAWSTTAARLIRLAEVPVIPAFVHGSNGPLFQLAGLLHPRLRTLLLAREFINQENRTVAISIGRSVPWSRLADFAEETALIAHLRMRCYLLAGSGHGRRQRSQPAVEPLAAPIGAELLQAEVNALPPEQCLDRSGEFAVYFARSGQIPWLLQEIGLLRETTFRLTGEGTGRARDIDLYDAYYLHLFIWNGERHEVVGAYRLGLADRIVERFGLRGLYTQSLFRFGHRLLDEFNPAIELGRSFVRPEYQRSYAPLLLLWKGIGAFVARHPQYRVLFGPVSISDDYAPLSRQLMVDFLERHSSLPQLARLVRPRRPFRVAGGPFAEFQPMTALEQVSELVATIEQDEKGVPVLLRQYLKLGGRLLGFNVDPEFNDAVDGLIMVDLRHTDPKVLTRYMGREGATRFLELHGTVNASVAQGPQRVAAAHGHAVDGG